MTLNQPVPARLLIVDDDDVFRARSRAALTRAGLADIEEAGTGSDAIRLVTQNTYALVLLDWKLPDPDPDGLEVMRQIRQHLPRVGVAIVTGYAEADLATQAMDAGADDFLDKSPHFYEMLPVRVKKILRDLEEKAYLRAEAGGRFQPENMVGSSPAMKRVIDMIVRVAPSNATVLVYGESGTGKELVARAIHSRSPRARMPFVAVNCASIPEGLLESELFGHTKGAFTGAVGDKEGKFERAKGGIIFLDEIGDMSLALQAKMLRVLQDKTFERVGGRKPITVDVRVIAATNKDLAKEIQAGRFREDLYYRLNVLAIEVPPLRERREDIPDLVRFFVRLHAVESKKTAMKGVTPETMDLLVSYHYPGNIRELSNMIERAVTLTESEMIGADLLPPELSGRAPNRQTDSRSPTPFKEYKESTERAYLVELLRQTSGNISRAADLSGIERNNLKDKLKKHNVEIPHIEG